MAALQAIRNGPRGLRHVAAVVALVVVVAVVQFSVALVAARRPADAAGLIAAVILAAAAVLFPRILLVVVPLATMFPQRVGPAVLDLSVTDALTLLGLLAAIRFVPWRSRELRLVLGALAAYLGTLAVSLVVHHSQRAVLEWFHRGVLFGGAVLIGAAIVQAGVARQALRLFTAGAAVVAAAAVAEAIRTGFEPAYVFQLQKNHAGVVLAAAFVVAFAGRHTLAWPPWAINMLRVLLLFGLLATQSRASMLGLVAALAVRPLFLGRKGNQRALSIGVLAVALVLLVFTAMSIQANDLSRGADAQKFNSINTRTNVYEEAIQKVWLNNRFVGGGLRYFRDPLRSYPTPHNVVIGELAEVGLIGTAGLAVLLGATLLALRRSRTELAVVGAMAFVLRLTQGMADIFWVAGPLTIALVLVGMGLAPTPTAPPPTARHADMDAKQSSSTLPVPGGSS